MAASLFLVFFLMLGFLVEARDAHEVKCYVGRGVHRDLGTKSSLFTGVFETKPIHEPLGSLPFCF